MLIVLLVVALSSLIVNVVLASMLWNNKPTSEPELEPLNNISVGINLSSSVLKF